MPITVSSVLDSSAALLNDPNKITYTYLKQLPYFRIVYETAQNRLTLLGHPTLAEVSAVVTITAGTTEVALLDTQVSRDYVSYPVSVYERAVGQTEDDWVEMRRGKWEDLRTDNSTLDNWAWREGVIKLNPATTNRELKVRFSRVFAAILDETVQIEHPNFAAFLRHATAGYIAMFVMKDLARAQALNVLADNSMGIALLTATKQMQYLPAVRPPYFFRRR